MFIYISGISVGDASKQLSPDDLMFSLSHSGMSNNRMILFSYAIVTGIDWSPVGL